jgi:hypothetical protein
MVGASHHAFRDYFEPSAFLYYVPSLLINTFAAPSFLEFALEAIVPNNRAHAPRGKWWQEFSEGITSDQRATFAAFLAQIRREFWETIGPANQAIAYNAETIWSDSRPTDGG